VVPAGATSVTVTGVDLTAQSLVLATLQQDLGSSVYVRAACQLSRAARSSST
jgi:hypothetical protein